MSCSCIELTSATQELFAVFSRCIAFRAMGPPAQQTIYPESDQNLNNSREVQSGTMSPNCLPQQTSLKPCWWLVAGTCIVRCQEAVLADVGAAIRDDARRVSVTAAVRYGSWLFANFQYGRDLSWKWGCYWTINGYY
eukprot:scaffold6297_cov69-Cyclotella_meneghiniana.AAC.2